MQKLLTFHSGTVSTCSWVNADRDPRGAGLSELGGAAADTNPLCGFVSFLSSSLPVFPTTLRRMGMHSVTQFTKEGLCWTRGRLLLPLSKLLADM